MNKRIKELIYAAGGQYDGENTLTGKTRIITDNVDFEKFAELIVNKCTTIARNTDLEDIDGGDSAVLNAVATQIEDYFGVKS